jgi:transketolase
MVTGSEVQLVLAAQEKLKKNNIQVRVVSMPSWGLFEKQSDAYKEKVLPKAVRKRLSVEAGSPIGWLKYVTDEGDSIGIDKFGKSAPGDEVMKKYGFTVENVVKKAKALLSKKN